MAKKTLGDTFGSNSYQDANMVFIAKSGLVSQGLTATANNTGQSIIAALLKLWVTVFTTGNRTTNVDETVTVTYDGQTGRNEGNNLYRVDTYRIQLFKLTPPQDADPDDY